MATVSPTVLPTVVLTVLPTAGLRTAVLRICLLKVDGTGGSNGACMRMSPEKDWGANAGLDTGRNFIEGATPYVFIGCNRSPDRREVAYLWPMGG